MPNRPSTPVRRKRVPRPVTRMYIAAIVRVVKDRTENDLELWLSGRGRGDWASFIGTDREQVVAHAMRTAGTWNMVSDRNTADRYEVWVGELTGLVRLPQPRYDVVQLRRVK